MPRDAVAFGWPAGDDENTPAMPSATARLIATTAAGAPYCNRAPRERRDAPGAAAAVASAPVDGAAAAGGVQVTVGLTAIAAPVTEPSAARPARHACASTGAAGAAVAD
jgi:hypothetical protein